MPKVLRWIGWLVGGLAALAAVAAIAVFALSNRHINRRYDVALRPLSIPSDSATMVRGRHFATAISKCVECHGPDLGGQVVIPDPTFALIVASNITRGKGSAVATFTDADWVRAIRHGVKPDGRPILIMPVSDYHYLSDGDLAALIAYVKSVPPIDRELPPTTVGPIARMLLAAGKLPIVEAEMIRHDEPPPPAPPAGVTVEYGRYIANVGGCTGCHGPGLSGGPVPGTPPEFKPARNITPSGIGTWSEQDFFRALRDGKRPDGLAIDSFMPWPLTRDMTDDEIHAVWLYLKSVPPREYGNR